jgi:TolB protein
MASQLDGRIAFSRCLPGVGQQVFVTDAIGGDARQLTFGGATGENWLPVWSPDGARLCLVSRRDGYSSLYLMDADGTVEQQLTRGDKADDDFPAWSPDGGRIVFARGDSGGADALVLLDLAARTETPLTQGQGFDSSPSWSPEGGWIVFRRSLARAPGLHVVPADGGKPRFLVPGRDPDWSPDGAWVAYSHGGLIWALPVTAEVEVAGPALQLTGDPRVEDSHPSWSPEGGWVVFSRKDPGNGQQGGRLIVLDIASGDEHDIGQGEAPDWQ